jgi:hypothetical protein
MPGSLTKFPPCLPKPKITPFSYSFIVFGTYLRVRSICQENKMRNHGCCFGLAYGRENRQTLRYISKEGKEIMEVLQNIAQSSYQYDDSGSAGGGLFLLLIYAVVIVGTIAGAWKIFEKAGQPGWAAIVPFYNTYILLKIAGRPGWWLLLYLIPLVNLVIAILELISKYPFCCKPHPAG